MVNSWEIDKVVNRIVSQPILDFSPAFISNETNLPLPIVFERLIQLVKEGKLTVKWEIRCPDYCGRKVIVLDDFPDRINLNLECMCGNEFEVTPDMVFPRFEINPEYKRFVLEEDKPEKKNTSRSSKCNSHIKGFRYRRCIPR
jgi:hypothetical protein